MNQKILQEKLIIRDNVAFGVFEEINEFRKIDGCAYFKEKVEEQKVLEAKKVELEQEIKNLENQLQLNKKEQLLLESSGYCPMDTIAYTRIGGVVTGEYLTHRKDCLHKGD